MSAFLIILKRRNGENNKTEDDAQSSLNSRSRQISRDLVGHLEWRYLIDKEIIYYHWNLEFNIYNFAINTVPADGLAPWGVRSSADMAIIKFGPVYVCSVIFRAFEGSITYNRHECHTAFINSISGGITGYKIVFITARILLVCIFHNVSPSASKCGIRGAKPPPTHTKGTGKQQKHNWRKWQERQNVINF